MHLALPLAALLACSAPNAAPDPAPPQGVYIVLVTLDTLRADRVGAYGDSLARTPNLDRLAGESALFRSAWTVAPLTLPAHTAMLSGQAPHVSGVRDNGQPVPAKVPLVAEALRDAGYATGAFVGAYVLDGTWGLDRGFDTYGDGFHPEDVAQATSLDGVQRPGREVIREATAWWAGAEAEGPRFMWVHLFEPHAPWTPSADWPADADPYRGDVFEADRALGPLLTAVGDDAWVVVVGDHGESLWDDGELHHGLVLNRSTLRVPLFVRPPGGLPAAAAPTPPDPLPPRPGAWVAVPELTPPHLDSAPPPDAPRAARVVESPVSVLAIADTLRDLAGLPHGGTSLRAALEGSPPSGVIVAETTYPARHLGWTAEVAAFDGQRWLARDGDGLRLYDARADPWLDAPLDQAAPAALVAALDSVDLAADPHRIDPTLASRLAALGYAVTTPSPDASRPSARAAIAALNELRVIERGLEVAPSATATALEELLARAPRMLDAWTSLGVARLLAQQRDEAVAAFERAATLAPDDPLVLWNLAVALRAAGRADAALDLAEGASTQFPTDPRWWRFRVDSLARAERPEGVRDGALAGLQLADDDPYLLYMLGLAQLQLGEPDAAIHALSRAEAAGTRARDIGIWKGKAHEARGDVDAAIEAWHAAARANPEDLRPVVAAGLLLASNDRCRDAAPFLYTAMQRGVRTPELTEAWQRCGQVTGN